MIDRLGSLGLLRGSVDGEEGPSEEGGFRTLRLFLAELLLTAGVQASVEYLRERSADPGENSTPASPRAAAIASVALRVAPAVLGPLAAAAQANHALGPSDRSRNLTRILNGAVIGAGAAGLTAEVLRSARGERPFSFAPLLFGYGGVLGVLLDHEESAVEEETEQLRRRARLIERWVPRRRTRVEKIVVHV